MVKTSFFKFLVFIFLTCSFFLGQGNFKSRPKDLPIKKPEQEFNGFFTLKELDLPEDLFGEKPEQEPEWIPEDQPFCAGFIKNNVLFAVPEILIMDCGRIPELVRRESGPAVCIKIKLIQQKILLYQVLLRNYKPGNLHLIYELWDSWNIRGYDPGIIFRWRLQNDLFWGTGYSVNNQSHGIFQIPLSQLGHFEQKKIKKMHYLQLLGLEEKFIKYVPRWSETGENGDIISGDYINFVWWRHGGLNSSPCYTQIVNGLFFDFLTQQDGSLLLFALYCKDGIKCKKWPHETIEVWHYRMGKFKNGPRFDDFIKVDHWETIRTNLAESFFVFEKEGDYYFLTFSGNLVVAPKVNVTRARVFWLIGQLESDDFGKRERAQKALINLNKPCLRYIQEYLESQKVSLEEKKRLLTIIKEIGRVDRKTFPLWQEKERPIKNIIFDLDSDRTFAFTKKDKKNQVLFFEVGREIHPQVFKKTEKPIGEALPPAVKDLYEYAQFVIGSRKGNSP